VYIEFTQAKAEWALREQYLSSREQTLQTEARDLRRNADQALARTNESHALDMHMVLDAFEPSLRALWQLYACSLARSSERTNERTNERLVPILTRLRIASVRPRHRPPPRC